MDKKILIVDDAAFIREILRGIFERQGYRFIIEATDGAEAIQLAMQFHPDVIFMDLVLPEKNGMDVAKDILERVPTAKLVACSSLDHESIFLQAMEIGFSTFLSKPFNEIEVLRAVNDEIETLKGVGT